MAGTDMQRDLGRLEGRVEAMNKQIDEMAKNLSADISAVKVDVAAAGRTSIVASGFTFIDTFNAAETSGIYYITGNKKVVDFHLATATQIFCNSQFIKQKELANEQFTNSNNRPSAW